MATQTESTRSVRKFLGTGFSFPMRVSPSGNLTYSSGEESVREAIWILLGTAKGERQMLPTFGCGIQDLVFAPNNQTTWANVQHLVKDALTNWEPRIDVLDVDVNAAPDEANTLLIRVSYRIRSNNAFGNLVYPFYITEGAGQ
jgi:Bacteriophage baseplate protein W